MKYRNFSSGAENYEGYTVIDETASSRDVSSVLAQTYNWMALGLLVTAIVSFLVASYEPLFVFVIRMNLLFFIAKIGLVIYFSSRIMKMSVSAALTTFLVFSALMGTTMSYIFFVYTQGSIASTFMITAGMFAGLSAFGYMTKMDLTGMGSICYMALIGLIIASFANWFLQSPAIYWAVTYLGVLVFCGLTAYDVQNIKRMVRQNPGMGRKIAVYGALQLYLDFINLFLHLLRIFGRRR